MDPKAASFVYACVDLLGNTAAYVMIEILFHSQPSRTFLFLRSCVSVCYVVIVMNNLSCVGVYIK